MKKVFYITGIIAFIMVAIFFALANYYAFQSHQTQTYEQKKMYCLSLGSNLRYQECIKLINK